MALLPTYAVPLTVPTLEEYPSSQRLQPKTFNEVRSEVLRQFKRYIRNNGRIHDQEANNIYNLALLEKSDISPGMKKQIVTRCNNTVNEGFNSSDRFQIDFSGRQYNASCIESLLEGVMKTNDVKIIHEKTYKDLPLYLITLLFFIVYAILYMYRKYTTK